MAGAATIRRRQTLPRIACEDDWGRRLPIASGLTAGAEETNDVARQCGRGLSALDQSGRSLTAAGRNNGRVTRLPGLNRPDRTWAYVYLRPGSRRLSGDQSGFKGALASRGRAMLLWDPKGRCVTGINRADTASDY